MGPGFVQGVEAALSIEVIIPLRYGARIPFRTEARIRLGQWGQILLWDEARIRLRKDSGISRNRARIHWRKGASNEARIRLGSGVSIRGVGPAFARGLEPGFLKDLRPAFVQGMGPGSFREMRPGFFLRTCALRIRPLGQDSFASWGQHLTKEYGARALSWDEARNLPRSGAPRIEASTRPRKGG